MKRLFALILAAVMMLALAACGNSDLAEPALEDGSQTPNSTNVQSEPSDPADNATPDSSQTDDSAQAEQTEGGTGLSNTETTIADITGGTMKDGFAISGTTARNDRDTAKSKVTDWLREDGLIE